MSGPDLKAIEHLLLAEVLDAFAGHCDDPGHPLYEDDPDRGWPMGMCDSTCETLLGTVEDGGYGWGERYGLRWRSGGFRGRAGREAGHAWLAAADGTIVDPTVGQFVPGPALRVILAGDPLYDCYSGWAQVEGDAWNRAYG